VYDELIRILGQLLNKIVSARCCCVLAILSLDIASIPAVPSATGALQFGRCQFLQEFDGADDEAGF
jgi:hypothetical protein